ncbi:SAM-dependent methyltransferase [Methanocella sp. CWC-04]|uniref:SAM-dependent methyltransferase n=1 Tax=Methanooceanicella nereidis TaxID=2052831 RepID=A0AAP2W6I8_9EURY|nr:tRNA (adenine-N1)-methyltransferase [Methanocella sp. CWC-04]MCD1295317.1 SAM-dependent methyltransferase [Methanocella sp. CWC-04]
MIAQGEYILLKAEGGREYFTSVRDEKLHTDLGIVDLKNIEGLEWGAIVYSHLGKEFKVLKPRTPDFFKHIKRTGAPMMPKDIGTIISYTGVCPDDTILDAGTGSGVLAIYLGTIAKKVITYEANEHFVNVARKNVDKAGLKNIEVRHGNIVEEIKSLEGPFDVVTLDMQEAAKVVHDAKRVLMNGGFLATYSPFFEQTSEIRAAVEREGFNDIITVLINEHELEFGERGTRPSTRVGHTGFLTFARK